MKKRSIYPEITIQMQKHNETQFDLAKLIGKDHSQISRKIAGYIEWYISEVFILCNHFDMPFEKLFRREEI